MAGRSFANDCVASLATRADTPSRMRTRGLGYCHQRVMEWVGIVQLQVSTLVEDGEEPGEVETWTLRLLAELSQLDGVSLGRESEDAAAGAKGIGSAVGVLLAHVKALDVARALIEAVRSFAQRSGRSVEITLDGDTLKLTGASREQQQLVTESFLARHPIA